jgi:hypothetical protein
MARDTIDHGVLASGSGIFGLPYNEPYMGVTPQLQNPLSWFDAIIPRLDAAVSQSILLGSVYHQADGIVSWT